jgi:hypothetical protein
VWYRTVVASMLTPAQFASTPGGGDWVLADGQSVSHTAYATLTGNTTAPDLRGMFLRGRNEGRADGQQNSDGELALGSYQADPFDSHVHNISGFGSVQLHNAGSQSGTYIQSGSRNTAATRGNETRSRNVTVNSFLRAN